MPRTKVEWAERVTTSADNNKNLTYMEWEELCPHLLRKEHQRAVRICKRLEREAIDRQEPDCTRCYLEGVRAVLAALQKGRA